MARSPREITVDQLKSDLRQSISVIGQFNSLIDAYVLDYYTEDHWNRLSPAWRSTFDKFDVKVLADLLEQGTRPNTLIILPLSLLALRTCVHRLSASREVLPSALKQPPLCRKHLYKQVKEKKCHEINRMAEICAETARKCNVKYIVDFGAGLGHLSRIISFQDHGLRVCCLEQDKTLSAEASVLDERAKRIHERLQGRSETESEVVTPVHLNFRLTADTDFKDLLQRIKDAFGIHPDEEDFSFGLVGLHPCGDLTIILTRFFLQSNNVRFLNIVGCCYMKLSTSCHPVSRYLKQICPNGLSYPAREIACHAIESYAERLRTNNYDYLKIHCYRALIERILQRYDPRLRHCGLKSVKQKEGMTFQDYARIVTKNLENVNIQDEEFSDPEITKDLDEWKKVFVFGTLRLFLAPLLETILLYDRMLWILESDDQSECELRATFDPLRSPRNHVLIADRGSLTVSNK